MSNLPHFINSSGVPTNITFFSHGFLITEYPNTPQEREEFYNYRMITSIGLYRNAIFERNDSLIQIWFHGNNHHVDLGTGNFRTETFQRLRKDWHDCVTKY